MNTTAVATTITVLLNIVAGVDIETVAAGMRADAIETNTNIGIATWGGAFPNIELTGSPEDVARMHDRHRTGVRLVPADVEGMGRIAYLHAVRIAHNAA
jgi:hypothetical protein